MRIKGQTKNADGVVGVRDRPPIPGDYRDEWFNEELGNVLPNLLPLSLSVRVTSGCQMLAGNDTEQTQTEPGNS